jgi:hypothetical protein
MHFVLWQAVELLDSCSDKRESSIEASYNFLLNWYLAYITIYQTSFHIGERLFENWMCSVIHRIAFFPNTDKVLKKLQIYGPFNVQSTSSDRRKLISCRCRIAIEQPGPLKHPEQSALEQPAPDVVRDLHNRTTHQDLNCGSKFMLTSI